MLILPTWTFKTGKASEGIRTTGHEIKCQSTSDPSDIYKMALAIDCQLDSGMVSAVFNIFSSIASKHNPVGERDQGFGSWFFQFDHKRLVYDGRDDWLIAQTVDAGAFKDVRLMTFRESLKAEDLLWLVQWCE